MATAWYKTDRRRTIDAQSSRLTYLYPPFLKKSDARPITKYIQRKSLLTIHRSGAPKDPTQKPKRLIYPPNLPIIKYVISYGF